MVNFKEIVSALLPTKTVIKKVAVPTNFDKPKGTSGTEIYAGYFQEEYLTKIHGMEGAKLFDEMRRSDSQIAMLLSVVKNPIRSAKWAIESVDEEDEEQEIAAFIEHVLFKDLCSDVTNKKKKFSKFLDEALTHIEFGHSVFEVVHKRVIGHERFGDYIGIRDLGFRSQKTIEEWNIRKDGSLENIRQIVHGDLEVDVEISGDNLLIFSMNDEGDNYEGVSMIRPCYGNWFRKNAHLKNLAIGIEKTSQGIPVATLSDEFMNRDDYDEQFTKVNEVMEQFAAHENQGLVLPAGVEFTQFKMEFDADKVQKAIDAEDVRMSKRFLANFMELGMSGGGGSYSLGSDLSDIFLAGIQYITKGICEGINENIIPTIIKAKYGARANYPQLVCRGINDKAGKELSEVLATFIDKGVVKPSDRLEDFVHDVYGLPEVKREQEDDEDIDDEPEEKEEPDDDSEDEESDLSEGADDKTQDKIHDPVILDEGKVSGKKAASFISEEAEKLEEEMKFRLELRSDLMIEKVVKILNAEGSNTQKTTDVLALSITKAAEYKKFLLGAVSDVGIQTQESLLKELGKSGYKFNDKKKFDGLPRRARDRIKKEVELVARYQDADLEKMVFFVVNNEIDKGTGVNEIVTQIKKQRRRYLAGALVFTAATNILSKVVNGVRNDVFTEPDIYADIESFVFDNPDPKSAICQNLAGRVFSKEEYKSSPYLTPLHHNCKSIIRAQTKGAKGNLPIDPKGLTPSGTDEEIEKILKSKTL